MVRRFGSSSDAKRRAGSEDKRVKVLVGLHAAAFAFAATATFGHMSFEPPAMFFLAIVFADAGLLGVWAALGNAPWQIRLGTVSMLRSTGWRLCSVADEPKPLVMDVPDTAD